MLYLIINHREAGRIPWFIVCMIVYGRDGICAVGIFDLVNIIFRPVKVGCGGFTHGFIIVFVVRDMEKMTLLPGE